MTTKTTFICDRCGKESETPEDWIGCYRYDEKGKHRYNVGGYFVLCPSCSERALSKPLQCEPIRCGGNCHEVGDLMRRDSRSLYYCAGCRHR